MSDASPEPSFDASQILLRSDAVFERTRLKLFWFTLIYVTYLLMINELFYALSSHLTKDEHLLIKNENDSRMPIVRTFEALLSLMGTAIYCGGMIDGLLREMRNEPFAIGSSLRTGLRRSPVMAVSMLLFSLQVILGFIMFVLPGITFLIWGCLLPVLAIDQNAGTTYGLRRSKELVRPNYRAVLTSILPIQLSFLLNFAVLARLLYCYLFIDRFWPRDMFVFPICLKVMYIFLLNFTVLVSTYEECCRAEQQVEAH